MTGCEYIKSKSNGFSLYDHTNAVLDVGLYLVNKFDDIDVNIIKYASIFHDLGKANPLFQSNMDNNDFSQPCRHEISSILFSDFIPDKIRDEVVKIILNHHKSFNEDDTNGFFYLYDRDRKAWINNHVDGINEWGENVKTFLSKYYNIEIKVPSRERCIEIMNYYKDLFYPENLSDGFERYNGVFQMADHLGSACPSKVERDKITKTLFTVPDTSIYNTEDKRYPLSSVHKDRTKRHTLLIAPCGSGKTNVMMKVCSKRIFYLLPFQASINAMYQRLRNDLGEKYSFAIKHASYSALPFVDDNVKMVSGLFGSSVKVETPFQLMSILLLNKGYEAQIMDIKGQDVIFDEIHTYQGVLTNTAILNLIAVLKFLDCNIHICSATMPSYLQRQLVNILGEDNTQIIELSKEDVNSFNRHIVHTIERFDIDDVIKRYNNGEKVLVVRNRVKWAQDTYTDIKSRYPNVKILLLHSRFKRKSRNTLEYELINSFNNVNEPCIVVSTQVVEVSLDINFDCMFTDVADIMNLIQRFGRVNRQRNNIGVMKDVFVVNLHNENDYKPYTKEVCDSTMKILREFNGKVLMESELQRVIDFVHPTSISSIDKDFMNPLDENCEWVERECITQKTRISEVLNFDVGSVGVLDKDKEEYLNTGNTELEIPLLPNKLEKYMRYPENSEFPKFYIIRSNQYDEELGLL